MAQYQMHTKNPPGSPTLDALYQDLDSFINELNVSNTDTTPPPQIVGSCKRRFQRRASDDENLTQLESVSYTSDLAHASYSPLLENYMSERSFSDEFASVLGEQLSNPHDSDQDIDRQDDDASYHDDYPIGSDDDISPHEALSSPKNSSELDATEDEATQSPPKSPTSSFLEATYMNARTTSLYPSCTEKAMKRNAVVQNEMTKIAINNGTIYTTRSSSLNRSQPSAIRAHPSSLGFKAASNPTSPLTKTSSTHPNITATLPEEDFGVPNYALMSQLAEHLISEMRALTKRRRIFSTAEYPNSFNGEEAVRIIKKYLPEGTPDSTSLKLARSFVHTVPPLIYPISYSEKSTRRNTLYNRPEEVYDFVNNAHWQNPPQGVYTMLTRCYSDSCLPGQGGCYAPCCPNKLSVSADRSRGDLQRHASLSSSMASSHDTALTRAWSATVSREVLEGMPDAEIKRQEAIHEIIYTEEDYLRDLNLLHDLFAEPLSTAQCIEPDRRAEFCRKLFNNYEEILDIHRDLCRDLRDHQNLCQAQNASGFVDRIGNIFLRHLPRFMDAYLQYGPHVALSEYFARKEMESNILWKNFIHEKEMQAETRKLPFRHFIVLPVTRLQRYPLLIGAILKKTNEDHPDMAALTKCSDIIRKVAEEMNQKTEVTDNTLRIYNIHDRLRYKREHYDLQLIQPGRKLLYEGHLMRRSHRIGEAIDMHVFLFDHLLLMTHAKKVDQDEEYHVSKRPIPLELLHILEASDVGLRTMSSTSPSATQTTTVPLSPSNNSQCPIILRHLGRNGRDYALHADNMDARLDWKRHIIEAKRAFEKLHEDRQVFMIQSLSDTTFRGSRGQNAFNFGKVTCSVEFRGAKGNAMVAIGTQTGVWMGVAGDTNCIEQVLDLSDIKQIAVLEKEHIFIVLSDKELYAYSLDALDPTSCAHSDTKPSYHLARHISYFNSGNWKGRTLVIAMKKRGMDSHFKAFEPICGDLRDPMNAKFLTTKSRLFSKAPSWFKIFKEFYIGTDSYALDFLKARIMVICIKGFEIIDLDNLSQNRNLPDLQEPEFEFVSQRSENLKPLGMFRCSGEQYLLCYDEFSFMVDSHGRFIRDNYAWIPWTGTPQSVAFRYPYVIGFDSQFIEVRNVKTGELTQILAGEHMRCLQFDHHTEPPALHGCMAHPEKPEYQYVFQLIDTSSYASSGRV